MKTVDFFHALPGLRPTDSRIGATQRNVLCLCLSSLRFPPNKTLSPHLRCGALPTMLTEVEITLQGKLTDMKALVRQIEERFGFSQITTKLTSENSFLLERETDHASISVVANVEAGTYSVQIEKPDDSVWMIGFNIPFVSERLSVEQMFEVVGEFIRGSYLSGPASGASPPR